jgi:hypothetical protein
MNRRTFLWLGSLGAAAVAMAGRIARDAPLVRPERNALAHVGSDFPTDVLLVKDHERFSKVFAYAGDVVTCESGHPICTFAETVKFGQQQDVKRQLTAWTQEEPEPGLFLVPVCAQCEARFVDGNGHFHFPGGWR